MQDSMRLTALPELLDGQGLFKAEEIFLGRSFAPAQKGGTPQSEKPNA
jgi:hypothetical protein